MTGRAPCRLVELLHDRRPLPLVMGILNVTPDSFSDGGEFYSTGAAIDRAVAMVEEGASIIDVGPESTRPGAGDVAPDQQIRRAIPVIEGLRCRDPRVAISIDTLLAPVAQAAIAAGADLVNDVSALRDDVHMARVVADAGVDVVLMHRRGISADMQRGGGPHYENVVEEVYEFLRRRRDFAVASGIDASRIVVDPGIGFGKRVEHNWQLMGRLDRFVELGQPVLVGASRKTFLGGMNGSDRPRDRLVGSLVCAVLAALAGVSVVRVHDVRPTVEAMQTLAEIRPREGPAPSVQDQGNPGGPSRDGR